MRRRQFLGFSAAAGVVLAQDKQDEVIATATQDTTPRVAIVLSSFKEGSDHDGTSLPGLADPQPPGAGLTSAQVNAMARAAIDLAATRGGDFASTVETEDWVVIQTRIRPRQPHVRGSVADPRIVRAVISYLVENKKGLRFTVAGSAPETAWASEWEGEFGGLSYRKMVEELTQSHRGIRFEILDLGSADTVELPVPGGAVAGKNPGGVYAIPKVIQQCDRVISVAPLATDPAMGVALSMANYLGISKGDPAKLGAPDEVLIDLFGYHPADFAIAGGCWGLEGDGDSPVHHNLILAGALAPCVDAVAATAMGFNATELRFLNLADQKGYGINDVDLIWTRGNEPDEARREFKKPSRWRPAA
ncbi:MAG: DUF362 domain-containing protein [Bryobacterales bacterium]|nr:DUF362 domain-containing protein [Bryobacterales bacterium]